MCLLLEEYVFEYKQYCKYIHRYSNLLGLSAENLEYHITGIRHSNFFLTDIYPERGSDTDCFFPEINMYIADIDRTFVKPFKCTVFLGQENHELLIDSAVEIAQ